MYWVIDNIYNSSEYWQETNVVIGGICNSSE